MLGEALIHGRSPDMLAGRMFACGNNVTDGQLGLGDMIDRSSPVQVGSATDWRLPICGAQATPAGRRWGKLFTWGSNFLGVLGNPDYDTNTSLSSPVQVGSAEDWSFLAGSLKGYSFAGIRGHRAGRGKLFVWGTSPYGMLGTGVNNVSYSSPVQVGSLQDWKMVGLGEGHGLFLTGDGRLYGSGRGQYFGSGDSNNYSSPVQVGSDTNWTQIAANFESSAGIRGGKLFVWGNNYYGELPDGTVVAKNSPVQIGSNSDWLYVSLGVAFGLGIRRVSEGMGKLFAWGLNDDGQLGLGNRTKRSSPVQVGSETDWSMVRCGYNYTMAIRGGKLFTWGQGNHGVLGHGNEDLLSSPVQVGSETDWVDVCGAAGAMFCIRRP